MRRNTDVDSGAGVELQMQVRAFEEGEHDKPEGTASRHVNRKILGALDA